MEIILILIAIYMFGFEKSDFDRMKEIEKLPPFTKEEAEQYYNELKNQNK